MEIDNKIIGYIEEGIVIDHIPVGNVWRIVNLLKINRENSGRVSLGDGYESGKMGKKGVIKIEHADISEEQLNLIALVAENATVSMIKEGKVIKKMKAKIPEILKDIISCTNINCISNDLHEKVNPLIISKYDGFSCYYCGRIFNKNEIEFTK